MHLKLDLASTKPWLLHVLPTPMGCPASILFCWNVPTICLGAQHRNFEAVLDSSLLFDMSDRIHQQDYFKAFPESDHLHSYSPGDNGQDYQPPIWPPASSLDPSLCPAARTILLTCIPEHVTTQPETG